MSKKIILSALDVSGIARNLDGELFVATSVDAAVGDVIDVVVRLPRGGEVTLPVAVMARQVWAVDSEPGLLLRPLDDGDPLPALLHDVARGRIGDAEQLLAERSGLVAPLDAPRDALSGGRSRPLVVDALFADQLLTV